jgi:hypothetical protein
MRSSWRGVGGSLLPIGGEANEPAGNSIRSNFIALEQGPSGRFDAVKI